jgi:TonB family protein
MPGAGSPVTTARPGGSGNSGNASGGLGNLASPGSPGGSASNSSPGGGGNGGGGSSGPFGSGSGPVPKPTNPGRGGSPSRPPGAPLGTCISGCGKPNYPIAAREEGREGQVELICDIEPNGKTSNVRILTPSKYNDLNKAAMKQVQERKYAPSETGIPGEKIVIIFRLTD